MKSTYIEKTERSDTTNLQSSIVNIQFPLVRVRHSVMPLILRSLFSKFGTGHERFLQENKQEQQETYEYRGPINV